jgi:hypothetical protein
MEMRLVAPTRRTSRRGVLGAALLASGALAAGAIAQGPQIRPLPPGVPHFIGPGTQGTTVYEGPPFDPCSASGWGCGFNNPPLPDPIGEVADDVHLTQAGLLASFTFTYLTDSRDIDGVIVPVGPGDDVTAIVSFYANDPTDSTLPTGTPIASYTIPGLPRDDLAFFTHTFDVPAEDSVLLSQDLWVGVEMTEPVPELTASLALPALECGGTVPVGVPVLGTSHSPIFFGPAVCIPDPGLLFEPADLLGFVTNHFLTVRVFTEDPNQPPTCAADLSLAMADFLEVGPGEFVVTVGQTIVVPFTGTDPDGDMLTASSLDLPPGATLTPTSGPSPLTATLTWTPTAADDAGAPYTVHVTFTDPGLESTTCSVTIADVNLPPVCSAGGDPGGTVTAECTSADGATVMLNGTGNDVEGDPVSFHWVVSDLDVVLDNTEIPNPVGTFPIGVTMATLTVTDGRGGVCTSDVIVVVQDTTPPEVMVTTDVASLLPANHGMRTVTLLVTATDACLEPGEVIPITVTVRSDEPDNASGGGDGNTTGDVNGSDGFTSPVEVSALLLPGLLPGTFVATIQLRAERANSGDGRQYTIDVAAFDSADNVAIASCVVVVPHDRRGTNGP